MAGWLSITPPTSNTHTHAYAQQTLTLQSASIREAWTTWTYVYIEQVIVDERSSMLFCTFANGRVGRFRRTCFLMDLSIFFACFHFLVQGGHRYKRLPALLAIILNHQKSIHKKSANSEISSNLCCIVYTLQIVGRPRKSRDINHIIQYPYNQQRSARAFISRRAITLRAF